MTSEKGTLVSEKKPLVHVLGLGPGPIGLVTLETMDILREAGEVLLRTARHPCVPELEARGVSFRPLDRHYERGGCMEEVYAAIAAEVVEEARRSGRGLLRRPRFSHAGRAHGAAAAARRTWRCGCTAR